MGARIKVRSFLVKEGEMNEEEIKAVPPSPLETYYPCAIEDEIALKGAAAALRKVFGGEMTAIQLDELLTIATDATEDPEDPEHVINLRDAIDTVKEKFSETLAPEKETVKDRGGLYVMGTNRHESSRIDGQLRGRAGRQGDPGTSRFFLSFEDDMFVIFGGDGLQNILKTFRVSEDMPVEAPQVTDALDKVQLAVEEKYRDIRGQIFDFDEVLDGQRRVFYRRRQELLASGPDATINIMKGYNEETVTDIVRAQTNEDGTVKANEVLEKVGQFFPSVLPVVQAEDIAELKDEDVISFINVAVDEIFKAKVDDLEEKAKADGRAAGSLARSANYIALVSMDNAWSDHLQNMVNLQENVYLRKYQELNPADEYKRESLAMFEGLLDKMRPNTIFSLWQSLAPATTAAAQTA